MIVTLHGTIRFHPLPFSPCVLIDCNYNTSAVCNELLWHADSSPPGEKIEHSASVINLDTIGNPSPNAVPAGLSPVATRPDTPPPGAARVSPRDDSLPVVNPVTGGLVPPVRGRKLAEAKGGIAAAKGGSITLHAPATAHRTLSTLEKCLGALEPLHVALPEVD